MQTLAVVFESPERLSLSEVALRDPGDDDVVVDVEWSGISSGTERLLWTGRMPPFPGMSYPLVPGYESVGRVVSAGATSGVHPGTFVFVPGARCFVDVQGLFGGAARRLVVPGARVTAIDASLGESGVLLALAATAQHAIAGGDLPDLVVGHGVLGRLIARIVVAAGGAPTVWETRQERSTGGEGYRVVHPDADPRRDYRVICDASGDAALLDTLVARLAPRGEIVLAGFYAAPLSFSFPPAFMREARLRIAAQWQPEDLVAVKAMIEDGRLSLASLITHREPVALAADAYRMAFGDIHCLKMILDWKAC